MKYIVFLMLAVCVGCSGQSTAVVPDWPKTQVPEHGCKQYGDIEVCSPIISPGPQIQSVPAVNCFYGQSNGGCNPPPTTPLYPTGGQDQFYLSPNSQSPLPFATYNNETKRLDRFANCVTSAGIHYCPEGRYVQIPDAKPADSIVCPAAELCSTTASPFAGNTLCGSAWNCGTFVSPGATAPAIVCPNGFNCTVKPGGNVEIPFGVELDINPPNGDETGRPYLHNCSLDAGGVFICPPVAPTTRKATKAPSCSFWLYSPKDGQDSLYCGDHEADLDEMSSIPLLSPIPHYHEGDKDIPKYHARKESTNPESCSFWMLIDRQNPENDDIFCGDHSASAEEMMGKVKELNTMKVYHAGDKDIPKHKETKPSVREFYPPDPDKGTQILKASLRMRDVNQ